MKELVSDLTEPMNYWGLGNCINLKKDKYIRSSILSTNTLETFKT